jgi:hypothetical protein
LDVPRKQNTPKVACVQEESTLENSIFISNFGLSAGRLGEDAAVKRGAGFEDDLGLAQENALKVRGRFGIDVLGRLPNNA